MLRKMLFALAALLSIGGVGAMANYSATQGVGTTFGSVVVGGIHYAQHFICDLTTPGQCASVSAAGAVKVDGSAVTQPVSGTVTSNLGTLNGAATAAAQTTGNASLSSIDGKTPALGQALAAASVPVILPSATITTLTPPTTVTANLGTIGTAATAANQTSQITQETAINTVTGTTTDAAATAGSTGTVAAKLRLMTTQLDSINTNVQGAIPAGTNDIGNSGSIFPIGATAVRGSTTGTTAATAASLAATVGKINYVCGISIRANATAAATGNATLSDGTSTLNFTQWTAPAASGLGVIEQIFTPCRPASATNVAWTATSAAPGSGGVVSTSIWGYQK